MYLEALPRSAVRLLPGPFLNAQATALGYLLSLDTDRLLAPLRRETGLPPVAESYGNCPDGVRLCTGTIWSASSPTTPGRVTSPAARLHPLEHLPVVLARSPSDPAAGVRRLAPNRLAFALAQVDARPGETVTLVTVRRHPRFPLPPLLPPGGTGAAPGAAGGAARADEAALSLRDRTVDAVATGEQQPESDHRFEGQETWSGLTDELTWRAATGWWSYRLTDPDGTATGLEVVTHLSDPSAGSTRVLVDGHALGTLTPLSHPEGTEISQVLPLDPDRHAGTAEIRFEAVGSATAIRLRRVRLVR